MRKHFLFCACLAFTAPAYSENNQQTPFNQQPEGRFALSKAAYYFDPIQALKRKIIFEGKNNQTNHFCLIGHKWPNNQKAVSVIWKEEQTLILWWENPDNDLEGEALLASRSRFKLGRDTVKTEEELLDNDERVTKKWWYDIVNDCLKHGEKHQVEPFDVD